MDMDSNRFSPLPLTAFEAIPELLSASVLRDVPRISDSLHRQPEICLPMITHEASLTHIILTLTGLDGGDCVNVRDSTVN